MKSDIKKRLGDNKKKTWAIKNKISKEKLKIVNRYLEYIY